MIYATMQRSLQTRSQTVNDRQKIKHCYGATTPNLIGLGMKRHDRAWLSKNNQDEYLNSDVAAIFSLTESQLELLRVQLFYCCGLTPLVHYWQSGDEIRWSKSALWRLGVALGRSPDFEQSGIFRPWAKPATETLAIEHAVKPIALLPPARDNFDYSSKQLADVVGICTAKLHRLRRSSDALIQGEHYQQIKTVTNTIAYSWSIAGLNQVIAIVGGDHV
jgi:hypothetical protein